MTMEKFRNAVVHHCCGHIPSLVVCLICLHHTVTFMVACLICLCRMVTFMAACLICLHHMAMVILDITVACIF